MLLIQISDVHCGPMFRRTDRDDGEVGHRQNLWLENTLEKYKDKVKIMAIHHQIIPIPDLNLSGIKDYLPTF